MTLLEYLIQKNKNMILNSLYQNTIYKNKTLCEYFGVESKTKKSGKDFNNLVYNIVYDLPKFDYNDFLKNIDKYKKYPELYLRVDYKLIQIKDILILIDKYKDSEEIPVSFYTPSFFSRCYKVLWLNKNTGIVEVKYCKNKDEYLNSIGNYLHMDLINILDSISYDDYKDLF